MSVSGPQPYPGGYTCFRFNVQENITLQGYQGTAPPVPEPGTLTLSLAGAPLLAFWLVRKRRRSRIPIALSNDR
jgi:hypothetical protein